MHGRARVPAVAEGLAAALLGGLAAHGAAPPPRPDRAVAITCAPRTEPTGAVVVLFEDGHRQVLGRGGCLAAQVGPEGLLGWTYAQTQRRGVLVNDRLRVQRGIRFLFEVRAALPFIDVWGFHADGVVVKSRSVPCLRPDGERAPQPCRGDAVIELFALETGQLVAARPARAPELPPWARAFAE